MTADLLKDARGLLATSEGHVSNLYAEVAQARAAVRKVIDYLEQTAGSVGATEESPPLPGRPITMQEAIAIARETVAKAEAERKEAARREAQMYADPPASQETAPATCSHPWEMVTVHRGKNDPEIGQGVAIAVTCECGAPLATTQDGSWSWADPEAREG